MVNLPSKSSSDLKRLTSSKFTFSFLNRSKFNPVGITFISRLMPYPCNINLVLSEGEIAPSLDSIYNLLNCDTVFFASFSKVLDLNTFT